MQIKAVKCWHKQKMQQAGPLLRNVWLDCDTGHDDAIAIIVAGHSKTLNLLGVSTVCGNQTIEKTTENTLKILKAAGLEHIGKCIQVIFVE